MTPEHDILQVTPRVEALAAAGLVNRLMKKLVDRHRKICCHFSQFTMSCFRYSYKFPSRY